MELATLCSRLWPFVTLQSLPAPNLRGDPRTPGGNNYQSWVHGWDSFLRREPSPYLLPFSLEKPQIKNMTGGGRLKHLRGIKEHWGHIGHTGGRFSDSIHMCHCQISLWMVGGCKYSGRLRGHWAMLGGLDTVIFFWHKRILEIVSWQRTWALFWKMNYLSMVINNGAIDKLLVGYLTSVYAFAGAPPGGERLRWF